MKVFEYLKELNLDKKQIIRLAINVTLVIVLMIIVFNFSSEAGYQSKSTSREATRILLTLFKKDWDSVQLESTIKALQPIIRKLAHFSLYAAGGFLIYNIRIYKNSKRKNLAISVVIGALYAMTDEFHQLFVPGRSGKITDVMIDTCGVVTGCLVYILLSFILIKTKNYIKENKRMGKSCI